MVLPGVKLCYKVLHGVVWGCIVLPCVALCCMVLLLVLHSVVWRCLEADLHNDPTQRLQLKEANSTCGRG